MNPRGSAVIEVDSLRKAYGEVVAVAGVSFEVRAGEIFGMVGPNGAGKTTAIEMIEGLRRPDAGLVRVLGLDPESDGHLLRARIGVQLQESTLHDRLKVWEAVDLFSSFYERAIDWEPLLAQLGLAERRRTPFAKLSGGQKQRLFIALALVNDPEIVFLDELTAALDPQARRATWDLVRSMRDRGTTLVITTHSMEEAERLCDRVAIMDHGRIVALDTPTRLIGGIDAETRVVCSVEASFNTQWLLAMDGVTRVEIAGERLVVHGRGEGLAGRVLSALVSRGFPIRDLRTAQPTLEDVFLALTGRAMRD